MKLEKEVDYAANLDRKIAAYSVRCTQAYHLAARVCSVAATLLGFSLFITATFIPLSKGITYGVGIGVTVPLGLLSIPFSSIANAREQSHRLNEQQKELLYHRSISSFCEGILPRKDLRIPQARGERPLLPNPADIKKRLDRHGLDAHPLSSAQILCGCAPFLDKEPESKKKGLLGKMQEEIADVKEGFFFKKEIDLETYRKKIFAIQGEALQIDLAHVSTKPTYLAAFKELEKARDAYPYQDLEWMDRSLFQEIETFLATEPAEVEIACLQARNYRLELKKREKVHPQAQLEKMQRELDALAHDALKARLNIFYQWVCNTYPQEEWLVQYRSFTLDVNPDISPDYTEPKAYRNVLDALSYEELDAVDKALEKRKLPSIDLAPLIDKLQIAPLSLKGVFDLCQRELRALEEKQNDREIFSLLTDFRERRLELLNTFIDYGFSLSRTGQLRNALRKPENENHGIFIEQNDPFETFKRLRLKRYHHLLQQSVSTRKRDFYGQLVPIAMTVLLTLGLILRGRTGDILFLGWAAGSSLSTAALWTHLKARGREKRILQLYERSLTTPHRPVRGSAACEVKRRCDALGLEGDLAIARAVVTSKFPWSEQKAQRAEQTVVEVFLGNITLQGEKYVDQLRNK